jgi:hypothetical protein
MMAFRYLLFVPPLLALAGSAKATIIDFNDQPLSSFVHKAELEEDGYQIELNAPFANMFILTANGCSPECPSNGTRYALLTTVSGPAAKISREGSFDLVSFDVGEAHAGISGLWSPYVDVLGTLAAGGTVTSRFALDFITDGTGPAADFQTFTLPSTFAGLLSVQFSGTIRQQFSLDDVVLEQTAVPGPPMLGLLSLGLAGVIGIRRGCTS